MSPPAGKPLSTPPDSGPGHHRFPAGSYGPRGGFFHFLPTHVARRRRVAGPLRRRAGAVPGHGSCGTVTIYLGFASARNSLTGPRPPAVPANGAGLPRPRSDDNSRGSVQAIDKPTHLVPPCQRIFRPGGKRRNTEEIVTAPQDPPSGTPSPSGREATETSGSPEGRHERNMNAKAEERPGTRAQEISVLAARVIQRLRFGFFPLRPTPPKQPASSAKALAAGGWSAARAVDHAAARVGCCYNNVITML
jgi:hypothetical protein